MRKREAEKIYRSIFKKEISDLTVDRFIRISEKMERDIPPDEIDQYRKVVEKISDLTAVEYVSRLLGKNSLLVKKFQVMIYLGECLPENYNIFINEKKGLIKTLLIFAWVPFNSIYKFTKGFFTLKAKG